jgi:hypothetical protein
VGINLNGEPGEIFRTYKGLRQGGPFVPLVAQPCGKCSSIYYEERKSREVDKRINPRVGGWGSDSPSIRR